MRIFKFIMFFICLLAFMFTAYIGIYSLAAIAGIWAGLLALSIAPKEGGQAR